MRICVPNQRSVPARLVENYDQFGKEVCINVFGILGNSISQLIKHSKGNLQIYSRYDTGITYIYYLILKIATRLKNR